MLGLGLRPQWDRDSPERPEEAEKGQPYPRFGALLPREQCPKGRMRTVLQPAVSRQAVHYNSFKTHLPPELLVPGHTQDRQLATGGCFGLSVLCEMGPGDKEGWDLGTVRRLQTQNLSLTVGFLGTGVCFPHPLSYLPPGFIQRKYGRHEASGRAPMS
ncbi:hypothetical protein ACRRTK_011076 [Alexandromys fortis]